MRELPGKRSGLKRRGTVGAWESRKGFFAGFDASETENGGRRRFPLILKAKVGPTMWWAYAAVVTCSLGPKPRINQKAQESGGINTRCHHKDTKAQGNHRCLGSRSFDARSWLNDDRVSATIVQGALKDTAHQLRIIALICIQGVTKIITCVEGSSARN